ncbi:MAG: alkaline phosphatase family protein [Acidimicrobiia bacterium]|nr:alkaline phosphatase family protein [Acidimicrobiia bacterium]
MRGHRGHRSVPVVLGLASLIALIGLLGPADRAAARTAGAGPEPRTPIEHVVTLMQENHSFDNYFGTYPGADGIPEGTCMPIDPQAPGSRCLRPAYLGNQPIVDLGHTAEIFDRQYLDGSMQGFVSAFRSERVEAGQQAMGYYDDRDLPFYWNVADEYVLFDRFFTSAAGGSVWNHFYWVAGQPGNPEGDLMRPEGFEHVVTIFDRLEEAGVSWKFYVENYDPEVTFRSPPDDERIAQVVWAPILAIPRFVDDPELAAHIVPIDEFFDDLQHGELPAVSYMVPSGASEHPPGSIQAGERFVRSIVNAVMLSSAWDSTALIWTYDDWGGWYDHVAPPQVDEFGYGFRTPALLVSAYAKRGHIDSTTLDFTSILKFIEENWALEPLAERDRAAAGLDSAFDFTKPPRPPVILGRERHPTVAKPPDKTVIYSLYGGAGGLAGVIVAAGLAHNRRRGTAG